ncbi:hypothetical protein PR048_027241 [Dryococelus australis]|uniref:Uncharacterized protein n=1 Tax=Dryococelus australis TaxID=614101 RepID=A0ABQ9GEX2_9NEOP|nr:hypothetical protein PR048_027241 [Dryococelus australis]
MDASCLDMRSMNDATSPLKPLSRAKSEFNLSASTHSLAQARVEVGIADLWGMFADPDTPSRPKSMAVPERGGWESPLARALYAYLSSGDNQLSFLEGDIIALMAVTNQDEAESISARWRRVRCAEFLSCDCRRHRAIAAPSQTASFADRSSHSCETASTAHRSLTYRIASHYCGASFKRFSQYCIAFRCDAMGRDAFDADDRRPIPFVVSQQCDSLLAIDAMLPTVLTERNFSFRPEFASAQSKQFFFFEFVAVRRRPSRCTNFTRHRLSVSKGCFILIGYSSSQRNATIRWISNACTLTPSFQLDKSLLDTPWTTPRQQLTCKGTRKESSTVKCLYSYTFHEIALKQKSLCAFRSEELWHKSRGERNKGWQFGENLRTQCSGWFPLAYTEIIMDDGMRRDHLRHATLNSGPRCVLTPGPPGGPRAARRVNLAVRSYHIHTTLAGESMYQESMNITEALATTIDLQRVRIRPAKFEELLVSFKGLRSIKDGETDRQRPSHYIGLCLCTYVYRLFTGGWTVVRCGCYADSSPTHHRVQSIDSTASSTAATTPATPTSGLAGVTSPTSGGGNWATPVDRSYPGKAAPTPTASSSAAAVTMFGDTLVHRSTFAKQLAVPMPQRSTTRDHSLTGRSACPRTSCCGQCLVGTHLHISLYSRCMSPATRITSFYGFAISRGGSRGEQSQRTLSSESKPKTPAQHGTVCNPAARPPPPPIPTNNDHDKINDINLWRWFGREGLATYASVLIAWAALYDRCLAIVTKFSKTRYDKLTVSGIRVSIQSVRSELEPSNFSSDKYDGVYVVPGGDTGLYEGMLQARHGATATCASAGPPPSLPAPVPTPKIPAAHPQTLPVARGVSERRLAHPPPMPPLPSLLGAAKGTPGAVGNASLHSSNDSGFSNDPPPAPDVDYSDDDTSRILASRLGEPGPIPGRVAPGFSPCGNNAGRCRLSACFLVDLPFPMLLHSGAAPCSPHITHIGSQVLNDKVITTCMDNKDYTTVQVPRDYPVWEGTILNSFYQFPVTFSGSYPTENGYSDVRALLNTGYIHLAQIISHCSLRSCRTTLRHLTLSTRTRTACLSSPRHIPLRAPIIVAVTYAPTPSLETITHWHWLHASGILTCVSIQSRGLRWCGYFVNMAATNMLSVLPQHVNSKEWGDLDEASMNAKAGEAGDPRGNPPTSAIVLHDSDLPNSGRDPAGTRTRFAMVGGERSSRCPTAAPPSDKPSADPLCEVKSASFARPVSQSSVCVRPSVESDLTTIRRPSILLYVAVYFTIRNQVLCSGQNGQSCAETKVLQIFGSILFVPDLCNIDLGHCCAVTTSDVSLRRQLVNDKSTTVVVVVVVVLVEDMLSVVVRVVVVVVVVVANLRSDSQVEDMLSVVVRVVEVVVVVVVVVIANLRSDSQVLGRRYVVGGGACGGGCGGGGGGDMLSVVVRVVVVVVVVVANLRSDSQVLGRRYVVGGGACGGGCGGGGGGDMLSVVVRVVVVVVVVVANLRSDSQVLGRRYVVGGGACGGGGGGGCCQLEINRKQTPGSPQPTSASTAGSPDQETTDKRKKQLLSSVRGWLLYKSAVDLWEDVNTQYNSKGGKQTGSGGERRVATPQPQPVVRQASSLGHLSTLNRAEKDKGPPAGPPPPRPGYADDDVESVRGIKRSKSLWRFKRSHKDSIVLEGMSLWRHRSLVDVNATLEKDDGKKKTRPATPVMKMQLSAAKSDGQMVSNVDDSEEESRPMSPAVNGKESEQSDNADNITVDEPVVENGSSRRYNKRTRKDILKECARSMDINDDGLMSGAENGDDFDSSDEDTTLAGGETDSCIVVNDHTTHSTLQRQQHQQLKNGSLLPRTKLRYTSKERPKKEQDESDGLLQYGESLRNRMKKPDRGSRFDHKSQATGNMYGPWYDLWASDESVKSRRRKT